MACYVIGLLAILFVWVGRAPTPQHDPGVAALPDHGGLSSSAKEAPSAGEPERQRTEVAVDATGLVWFSVADDRGSPLDGVEFWAMPEGVRWIARRDGLALGRTREGHVRIPWREMEDAREAGHVLGVYHPECLSAFLAFSDVLDTWVPGATVEVVLRRLPKQVFRCEDMQGFPLSGASIVLSRTGTFGVGGLGESLDGLPGPSPDAIYVATCDMTGEAAISLDSGLYAAHVFCGIEYACIRASARFPVRLPMPERVLFVLERVYCAGLAVVGEEVVNSNVRFEHTLHGNAGQSRLAALAKDMQRSWKAMSGGTWCNMLLVFPKRDGLARARFSVCLERSGWHDVDVEFQPLVPGWQPTILDASRLHDKGVGMASVEVKWEHGRDLPLLTLRQEGDWRRDRHLFDKWLREAGRLNVPAGDYVLEAAYPPDREWIPEQTIVARAGEVATLEIVPGEQAAVMGIKVLMRDRRPANDVSVVLERDGEVVQARRLLDGSGAVICAPAGKLQLRVNAQGCEEQVRELELEAVMVEGMRRLEVVLEWKRKQG